MGLRRRLADLWQPWQPSHALVVVPLALIVAIAVLDVLAPSDVHLGPLLVVAPAVTASLAGPRLTAVIGALAVGTQTVIAALRGGFTTNHQVQITSLAVISLLLVVFCRERERRTRELARVRSVSEATQRVVLRPLPHRMGPLRIASLYLAAEDEAQIGGDLYAATRTRGSARLIIGDVRGKGLPAISDASVVMGAFREAAHRCATLLELVDTLEKSLCRHLFEHVEHVEHPGHAEYAEHPGHAEYAEHPGHAEYAEHPGHAEYAEHPGHSEHTEHSAPAGPREADHELNEHFVTALMLDIPDEDLLAQMTSCGHPPPLLLHGDRVTALDSRQPQPPLGMCDLPKTGVTVDAFTFEDDDTLLLYTDGVIEARAPDGSFYPLAERIGRWSCCSPESLLHHIRDDLVAHVGGRLRDDAAMVVIRRSPKLKPAHQLRKIIHLDGSAHEAEGTP
ncbi:PP2C family protein-serine/threonine phosphatase [Streptomyces sp. NPDC058371]|uniref:PP2C family protein-serine/threonine phosphatase n=1 Tax=Streptomyces sp. NPDC058371 TaxID=3346463 RepID=UPI003646B37D